MSINEYLAEVELIINSSSIVASYDLYIDRKTEEIAFISGRIDFIDESTLNFKEFVEEMEVGIEKYKYGYNYRIGSDILFRYDNAGDPRAKNLKSFPHHKHTKSGDIVESKERNFSEVIDEIESLIFSNLE